MNTIVKTLGALILFIFCFSASSFAASPWTQNEGYLGKTGGKFTHGLKHSLFSWLCLWTESREARYKEEFEGFAVGIAKFPIYTAAGLIQLVTFPIPVDVPDIGQGLHIPDKDCVGNSCIKKTPPAPRVNKPSFWSHIF